MSGYMGGGGDNLTSLYLSNPAMAQALRKQQMGLEMAQSWKPQGPVLSPWQGVDSLVKGLMGAYLFNKGNDDIQDAHDKGNADLADAMNKAYGGGGQTAPAQPQAPQSSGMGAALSGQPQVPAGQDDGWSKPYYSGMSDGALKSTIHQLESGGALKPGIVGDGGAAAGPMQVHQAALDDVNKAQGTNYTLQDLVQKPAIGKAVGDAYVGILQQRYPGRPDLVLAAYNGGMGNVDRGTVPPSAQQYAQRGLQAMGGTQYAGPGVPQDQQQQMPQQAPPTTGQNAPMVQEALRLNQQATQLMIDHPGDPRFHALAQGMMQRAQMLTGLDTYTTGPDGTQRNVRTGETKSAPTPAMNYQPDPNHPGAWVSPGGDPKFEPTDRTVTDIHGNTWAIGPGGRRSLISGNPTGIAGNGPENEQMRVLAEIGPKMADGTATPQERATFGVAAHAYQNYQLQTNPATGGLGQVPQRPLPPGMPQPGGAGSAGFTPITGGSRGPQSAQDVTTNVAKKDLDAASEEQAAAMKSHDILGTTATIRATAPQVTTGAGGDARLKAAQIFTALGVDPKIAQSWTGTNAAPGEVLQKKLFELSTGATRAMGAREPGSVMMMFQKNYPGMGSRDMTIDSMTRLIDMDQQYKEDETDARSAHLHRAVEGMANGQSYQGLSGYSQPNPRMYQAAALASGGMPFSVWSQGLTPQQQAQALKLAGRVYPDATALDKNGVMHKFGGGQ